jgi:hypothetical protein
MDQPNVSTNHLGGLTVQARGGDVAAGATQCRRIPEGNPR